MTEKDHAIHSLYVYRECHSMRMHDPSQPHVMAEKSHASSQNTHHVSWRNILADSTRKCRHPGKMLAMHPRKMLSMHPYKMLAICIIPKCLLGTFAKCMLQKLAIHIEFPPRGNHVYFLDFLATKVGKILSLSLLLRRTGML